MRKIEVLKASLPCCMSCQPYFRGIPMPVIFQNTAPLISVSLWKTEESLDEPRKMMSAITDESTCESDFKMENSKKAWMASRLALASILPSNSVIYRNENNGLGLYNSDLHICVSHTNGYAAAVVSSQPCGVDVEIGNDKIHKVAHKFVGVNEGWALDTDSLYHLWTAKETLFKIYGVGGLDFKTELHVEMPDEKKVWVGEIKKQPNGTKCVLYKKMYGQALLVWGIKNATLNIVNQK